MELCESEASLIQERVPGQLGIHREALSLKQNRQVKKKKERRSQEVTLGPVTDFMWHKEGPGHCFWFHFLISHRRAETEALLGPVQLQEDGITPSWGALGCGHRNLTPWALGTQWLAAGL